MLISRNPLAVTAALAVASSAPAGLLAAEPEPGLQGRVGFSYTESRGNSDSLGIAGDSTLEYVTEGLWLYDAKLLFASREESDVTTEERYEARLTANRYWTDDNYVFGRIEWRKNNLGGILEEWMPSVGVGRVILQTERHDLKAEIGAGYRFADLSDGTSEEGGALSGGMRYKWQISPTAEFYQNALVQWSDDNTYVESETGLRTAIIGNLSARMSYIIKHNTDVPEDRRNSDFFTAVGLEYQF